MTTFLRPRLRRTRPIVGALLVAALAFASGCGAGTTNDAATATAAGTSAGPGDGPSSSAAAPAAGPTLVVTVPDLDDAASGPGVSAASAPSTISTAPSAAAAPGSTPPAAPSAPGTTTTAATTAPETAPAAQPPTQPASQPAAQPATTAPALSPSGDGLTIQLANCDGCTVLATHRDVVNGLSAALVASPGGRALLLSVRGDGTAAGVINVPYGAGFPTPPGGILPCDGQGHCAVQGVQTDGRALLSAFALTDTGAWRNISGDDAFPSVTDRAAVVDLDGQLGLAVQDQGTGDPIWLLYRWLGDRFTVAGCAPDGDAPASVDAVSPDQCLS